MAADIIIRITPEQMADIKTEETTEINSPWRMLAVKLEKAALYDRYERSEIDDGK